MTPIALSIILALVAPAAAAPDSIVGLWATELRLGPAVRGELRVSRHGSAARAAITGRSVTFTMRGDSVAFALPDNLGAFRGALARDGETVDGFWIQPPGGTSDTRDPGGSGQPFASPLVLRPSGKDTWGGTVRPLESTFTLYLCIYRDAHGALVGAFRNPEMNSNGGASIFRVTQEQDSVWFGIRPDSARPELRLAASVARSPDRIRVLWPDLGRVLGLVRRTPQQVAAFFPRPPRDTAYVYRPPVATGDGWTTARARNVGLDEAALTRLVDRLAVADPALPRASLIHSLLVARHGKLVLDEYFFGFERERPHDTRSAGKTFASVMLGAAMMRGVAVSPETPVYDVLAGMGPFANPDPRKAGITVAHLMTHTSGLACDDNDDASPGNEDTMQGQGQQPTGGRTRSTCPSRTIPAAATPTPRRA